jgi:hypothetical protein
MPKVGLTKVSRARRLLRALKDLSSGLPSASEREEAVHSLKELSGYLDQVQRQLASVPTNDDVVGLIDTIAKLDRLLERAEANPVTARALGLEKAVTRQHGSPQGLTDPAPTDAALERFEKLTVDQVRELLRNENAYSLPALRSLAAALGARPQSRMGRDALVQRIVTTLINRRGYHSLASTTSDAPTSSEAGNDVGPRFDPLS